MKTLYTEAAKATPKSVFEDYANKGYSRKDIANIFNISESLLSDILKKLNVHTHAPTHDEEYDNKRAKFNIYKFDVIDTEEKSYWLGMLFSDGCVSTRNWSVCLKLAEKDLGHIIKFKNFLEDSREGRIRLVTEVKKDGKIYKSYSYTVYNKHFVKALISLGCVQNKSLILKFPNEEIFSDKKFIYDFIRGYVDGDGCISARSRVRVKDRLILSILGTEDFLTSVKKYFPQFGSIVKDKRCKVYKMKCDSNNGDQVAYKLYEHATIYLDRKYEKYVALCWLHNSETSDKIGESCDANAEVTPEIAKGSESTVENSE